MVVAATLLLSCATPRVAESSRPVGLARGQWGPLFVRFPDATVGAVRSWSNGREELRWRSTWRVKDLVADTNRLCVLTVDDDAFCVTDEDPRPGELLHEPGARDVGLNPNHELCVVTSAGRVRCVNQRAEAPYAKFPELTRLIDFTACGIDHDARLLCRGDQHTGAYWDDVVTTLLTDVRDAQLVPSGPAVTGCALLRTGKVWCFGSNQFGEQGTGQRSGTEPLHEVQGLPPIRRLAHTTGVTCAIDEHGGAWCFGAWFGPDYARRARERPRCERRTSQVLVPACPATGPGEDNPCLRMGGRTTAQLVEETHVVRDAAGQCADGQAEAYVPTPTRLTIVSNARDVLVRHEGVVFLTDDGELVSTFYEKVSRARVTAPLLQAR